MKRKTIDVFGVRSELIESYIEREAVDNRFKDAIKGGNEVVVYGSSKQGKTSLTIKHLTEAEYIKVECSPQSQPVDIYKSILRQMNVSYETTEVTESGYEHGGKVKGGFKIKIPWTADCEVGGEIKDNKHDSTRTSKSYFEYNLELAQDVSELLKKFEINKFIILENFHYLSMEVQESFAFDLRNFQDHKIIFIILGIWREAKSYCQMLCTVRRRSSPGRQQI